MVTTSYADKLVEDIISANRKSIKLNMPVLMWAEIRTDTEYSIDFGVYRIAVNKFSVKKNIFGEEKILIANGQHQITHFTKEAYDEIHRQMKK
jgi:hypothetical protein